MPEPVKDSLVGTAFAVQASSEQSMVGLDHRIGHLV
jgi:hypothetical protein